MDAVDELIEWVRCHRFGKYRGIVTSNDDPTGRGRVKVKVRAVLNTLEVWAMPCVPYAGPGVGFCSLPPKDAGVWIEFEGGDVSYPIWTGCFWADGELPEGAGPDVRVWKTEKVTVRIDDGADELQVTNASASKLTIASEVKAESGGASHSVGGKGVVSSLGAGKVAVTPASVSVNNGALEVT